jgi:plasmid stabilization system protein ParE
VCWNELPNGSLPRGDKSKYTDKQKRKAKHIEKGYERRGISKDEAERRAWATVNKSSGGGKKSGSGRGRKENKGPLRKADGRAVRPPVARKRANYTNDHSEAASSCQKERQEGGGGREKEKDHQPLAKEDANGTRKRGSQGRREEALASIAPGFQRKSTIPNPRTKGRSTLLKRPSAVISKRCTESESLGSIFAYAHAPQLHGGLN